MLIRDREVIVFAAQAQDKFRDERFLASDTGAVMKPDEPEDRSLVEVARGMDDAPGFHFRSKKPVIIKKIYVVERTRLPKVIFAAAIAGAIAAGAFYFVGNGRLQRERRLAEERLHEVTPPVSAIQRARPAASLPAQTRQASEETVRTLPTVRAVTAEANGRDVR